jgi:hypothetical protein
MERRFTVLAYTFGAYGNDPGAFIEDENKPLTTSILFRLGRVLSLGSGVIFRHFLFASTKEICFVPFENDNP